MSTIPTDYMQEKFEQRSISKEPQGHEAANPWDDAPDTPSETSSQDGSNELDGVEAEAKTPFRQWIDSETSAQVKDNPGIEATPRLLMKAQNIFDTDESETSTTPNRHGDREENQFEEYIPQRVLSSPDLPLLDQYVQYSMTDSDFQRFNEVLVQRIGEMEELHKTQIAEMQCKLDELRRELRDKDAEMLLLEERNEVLESTLEKIMERLQQIVVSSPVDSKNNTIGEVPDHGGLETSFIPSTESLRLSPKLSPHFGRDTVAI
ncbi:hypothetical protein BU17DRAFT_83418 [Hysterangium stoloniferum]|nr:hypothetical protein BU17DRAFT_83418 [Hysterangium stoloniferum]